MPTVTEIKEMTDEERAALNKTVYYTLAKQVALKIVVGVVVHIAVRELVKKLDSKSDREA